MNNDLLSLSLHAQTLLNNQQPEQAIDVLRQILANHPDHLDSWDHLAAALTLLENYEEADHAYEQCFRLGCTFPETLRNAARNAHYWGRPTRQFEHAQRMLNLTADLRYDGLRESAQALLALSKPVPALAACRQCVLEFPDDVDIKPLLARALLDAGLPEESLKIQPHAGATAKQRLALTMTRVETLLTMGEINNGIALAEDILREDPEHTDALTAVGFNLQYLPDITVDHRRQQAERFAAVVRKKVQQFDAWHNNKDPDRTLRIGFICGDFRRHPVAFFMLGFLQALQHRSLELYLYDALGKSDAITDKFRPLIQHWRQVQSISDKQLTRQIRDDQVDILIDLHGYTTGNRMAVMAMKPAPVQVIWLGYQGTSGLREIDYALADSDSVPVEQDTEFTEKIWRLPRLSMCFSTPESDYEPVPPPVLNNGYITFGCMNNPHKVNDTVLALWSRVMAAVPESRLVMRGGGFNQTGYRKRFVTRLQRAGIDPSRVTIERMAPRDKFLDIYSRVDIALDPFPYSGITTTAEALWSGVPVLALEGNSMVWRMGGCFVRACGMPEWVATSEDDYVRRAVNFASDPAGLASLRQNQRARVVASPLFDAEDFAAHFEQAMRQMWRLYVNKGQ
ncbi:MAG: hypothetical protein Q7L07_07990 [Pseudohongiella sp.]|nr:hypothetical protein [Pseudohongiella sp.]MDP2285637.1 hypothetical protein [Pseudohongiella sp.]